MAISALKNVIIIIIIYSCSTTAESSNSYSESSFTNGIEVEMKTDVVMEGTVNGHSFTIVGKGIGWPYMGDQYMNLQVVKGAPLPFAYDILTTAFQYGNRVFTKYPPNIADYFKQSFPDGYHWERFMPFEDQGMCTVTSHIRLKEEEENTFFNNIRFHCVNFPPDGPVMQRRLQGWMPAGEDMYPGPDGSLVGYVEKTLRVEGGGYYQAKHRSTYKANTPVAVMPDFHTVYHRIRITWHDEDYTNVELREVAEARYSPLPAI